MTEPDITESLGNGITRTTVIQAVEITRQGALDSSGSPGWRISLPIAFKITLPDQSILDQSADPIAYDFAELAYDPAVQQIYALIHDVTIRIVRGDLKPQPVVSDGGDHA
jgi:hypothetical protein